MTQRASRRQFMQNSTAIGAALWVGGSRSFARDRSANERVQYACIGAGGKGKEDSSQLGKHGDIIALCDVDSDTLDKASKNPAFKNPKTFRDWREMLEQLGDKIDGVTVSIPDHGHAPATRHGDPQGDRLLHAEAAYSQRVGSAATRRTRQGV